MATTLTLPLSAHRPAAPRTFVTTAPAFDSRELMRGEREVLIRHGDQVYRLRHTRNGKLILVK
ncbi:MAG TPA: hemin uptake protein HemP [Arenimonas sp.]|jgi:hemin uptake protein HemP|nr:hemin uptake protein HemP [Arenimonas sp.]